MTAQSLVIVGARTPEQVHLLMLPHILAFASTIVMCRARLFKLWRAAWIANCQSAYTQAVELSVHQCISQSISQTNY